MKQRNIDTHKTVNIEDVVTSSYDHGSVKKQSLLRELFSNKLIKNDWFFPGDDSKEMERIRQQDVQEKRLKYEEKLSQYNSERQAWFFPGDSKYDIQALDAHAKLNTPFPVEPTKNLLFKLFYTEKSNIRRVFANWLLTLSATSPFPNKAEYEKALKELKDSNNLSEKIIKFFDTQNDYDINQILRDDAFLKEYASKGFGEWIIACRMDFEKKVYEFTKRGKLSEFCGYLMEEWAIDDVEFINKTDQGEAEPASFKNDGPEALSNTTTGQHLAKAEALKEEGNRVVIISSHPSYLGALAPFYSLNKAGYKKFTENPWMIIGPRVLANIIIKAGVKAVGNLLPTLPATDVENILVKTPVKKLALMTTKILTAASDKKLSEKITKKLTDEECEAFEKLRHEFGFIFPEGSRSTLNEDGSITLKYINPGFLNFIRPGDYIMPLNQCGAEEILPNGKQWPNWKQNVQLSAGKPILMTAEMLKEENQQETTYMLIQNLLDQPLGKMVHVEDKDFLAWQKKYLAQRDQENEPVLEAA